jgi:hypothetical protein
MNETPLAAGAESSLPTSLPEAPPSRAATPVVGRREDLLGVRRQRDLDRLSYLAGDDFGPAPAAGPADAE